MTTAKITIEKQTADGVQQLVDVTVLTTTQVAALTTTQCAALTTTALPNMTTTQVAALNTALTTVDTLVVFAKNLGGAS